MNKSTIYGVGIGIVIGGMIYTVMYMWDEQEYYMGLNSTIHIQYYICGMNKSTIWGWSRSAIPARLSAVA